MIAKELTVPFELSNEDNICELLAEKQLEVVLTIGAGDIDQLVGPIKNVLINQAQNGPKK